MSDEGRVVLDIRDRVGSILFDRPQAYNSMTKKMYEELEAACDAVRNAPGLRVVTFRGAGGKAFVSGSDISGFESFRDGSDGVRYEAEMDRYYEAILRIEVPTVAIIDGFAVGGGLRAAAYCDIRIASSKARFGVPIARTLGNCLSMINYARLVAAFGEGRAKRMLYLAELIDAEEARQAGFLARVVAPEDLDAAAEDVVATLLENAPVTMRVSKAALARIAAGQENDGRDLIEACYQSRDFKTGVAAFLSKSKPEWTGS
jgi:enoyl-CoA hydratase/carnithine racemase